MCTAVNTARDVINETGLVHALQPLTVECPRVRLGDPVTAVGDLFVRQNLDLPDPVIVEDRAAWRLDLEGMGVARTITLGELQALPSITRRMVLECAGNARALEREVEGETSWGAGAVGCVDWTGVTLRTIAERLGPPSARFCTATGADAAGRADDPWPRRVERSIPAAKALADGLLAWQLNGMPIPLEHGGPLRFVVPGWFAVNSVKFVRRLSFGDEESDAEIMSTRYRVRPPGALPGPGQPTTGPLSVKSMIVRPADGESLPGGPFRVRGVAWSGDEPAARVELTVDGGRSWTDVPVDQVADPAAWRGFSTTLELPAGRHVLGTRATDAGGRRQPERVAPDAGGYANNGWRSLAVRVRT
jgi:sulfite oxidase